MVAVSRLFPVGQGSLRLVLLHPVGVGRWLQAVLHPVEVGRWLQAVGRSDQLSVEIGIEIGHWLLIGGLLLSV